MGQQFKPGDRDRPLYTLCFCRDCGQEYYPVWATLEFKEPQRFDPRDLSERSNEDDDVQFGYLMPDSSGEFDPKDLEGQYPEDWLEFPNGVARLKYHFRRYRPMGVKGGYLRRGWQVKDSLLGSYLARSGSASIPSAAPITTEASGANLSKLSGLSSEGRSSATTVLALSSLRHLIGTDLDEKTKKLLAFTDNRQDASLQAGHFNDFIQILILRGALLAAIGETHGGRLTDDVLAQRVLDHLRLDVGGLRRES